jgi:16S rRNA (uracil1498-N3)-methyltransferase
VADFVAGADVGVSLAEPGGGVPTLDRPTLLIGPEGGWAPEELACGRPRVALAPTVLRTETAAIVAATLLTALRAQLVRPL